MSSLVASGAELIEVTSPLIGQQREPVPSSVNSDVVTAVAQARRVQLDWAKTTFEERAAIMRRLAQLLVERQEALLDVIQCDTGKSRMHANDEILHVLLNAHYYAQRSGRLLADQRRRGAMPLVTKVTVAHQPKGVVGIICPWNYPFSLALCDAIPALMAGNSVVLRPDNQGIWSALHAVKLLRDAGLPDGVISIVAGDGPTIGGALIDEVDYICFTGSSQTGAAVAAKAAARLIGMSLELGGKNPMVVCGDADLKKFLDIAVRSCFTSAGQLCVSTERLFIHQQVYDQFVEALVEHVKGLKFGAELGWGYDMGSLASQAQLDRVRSSVEQAVATGAQVLVGGKARPDIGPFVFEPTVLAQVNSSMGLFSGEVFGPCVYVQPFTSYDEVIRLVNESPYGLSASVITKDVTFGEAIAKELRCGSVNINEGFATAFASVDAPMGGMGISGLGRRHGPEGLLRFVEHQTLATQVAFSMGNPFNRPDQQWARVMTQALRLLSFLRLR